MTTRRAIKILRRSNRLLKEQLRKLREQSQTDSDMLEPSAYDTLAYCSEEYEAVKLAINALKTYHPTALSISRQRRNSHG